MRLAAIPSTSRAAAGLQPLLARGALGLLARPRPMEQVALGAEAEALMRLELAVLVALVGRVAVAEVAAEEALPQAELAAQAVGAKSS